MQSCGYALKQKGYDIKVIDLDEKSSSNCYNPFMYIKRKTSFNSILNKKEEKLQEDDIMTLINTLMAATKSDTIDNVSGDPFWEKAENLFLQALFYYTLTHYPKRFQNYTTIMKLIRLSKPDNDGNSLLDRLFQKWENDEPDCIGVKQYKHFKVSAAAPKMMSTILMVATARLAAFNIKEIADLTDTDDLELERIGMPLRDNDPLLIEINKTSSKKIKNGKIAYFIITKPNNSTFNFLASMLYSQIFDIIDVNAHLCGGTLSTNLNIYMDEWAQLEIPHFQEELAYLRGLNVGITIGIQSLSQLKKKCKDSWEIILDCCDTILFLGSNSKETLEYFVTLIGKKTWYKKSSSRTFSKQGSNSMNWDIVGRELATIDELSKMPKRKLFIIYFKNRSILFKAI